MVFCRDEPIQTLTEVLSVIDPSFTVSFTRNNLRRATSVTTTITSLTQSVTLNQVFQVGSNRTELRANIGSTADSKNVYTYDKLYRLTDVVQTVQPGGIAVISKHITNSK
ncbi:MAG: hypothetical protein SGI77_17140 [Pirellulaceae bacterium]|nr:hypothetical protein [Pirellulaceae bacterium]